MSENKNKNLNQFVFSCFRIKINFNLNFYFYSPTFIYFRENKNQCLREIFYIVSRRIKIF
jgi:hypothetical protein